MPQAEGGVLGPRGPGAAWSPKVSWDLRFPNKCLRLDRQPHDCTPPLVFYKKEWGKGRRKFPIFWGISRVRLDFGCEEEVKEFTTGVGELAFPHDVAQAEKEDRDTLLTQGLTYEIWIWECYFEVLSFLFLHCKPIWYPQAFSKNVKCQNHALFALLTFLRITRGATVHTWNEVIQGKWKTRCCISSVCPSGSALPHSLPLGWAV